MKILFSTNTSLTLARSIASKKGIRLGKCEISRFIDEEISLRLRESVKGKSALVIGSTFPPAENLLELLILINTLKINGAKKITAIIPYFGYSRSDYQYKPGTPINARLMAKLIEAAGAGKVITIDLHSKRIKNFFNIPLTNLSTTKLLAAPFRKMRRGNLSVASPDRGGIGRAKDFAKELGIKSLIKIEKYRPKPEIAKVIKISGTVKNRSVIMVDDMIQSGNTILESAKNLKKAGAKKIYVCATHLAAPSQAINKLNKYKHIEKIAVTDSISHKKLPKKFAAIEIDDLIANNL